MTPDADNLTADPVDPVEVERPDTEAPFDARLQQALDQIEDMARAFDVLKDRVDNAELALSRAENAGNRDFVRESQMDTDWDAGAEVGAVDAEPLPWLGSVSDDGYGIVFGDGVFEYAAARSLLSQSVGDRQCVPGNLPPGRWTVYVEMRYGGPSQLDAFRLYGWLTFPSVLALRVCAEDDEASTVITRPGDCFRRRKLGVATLDGAGGVTAWEQAYPGGDIIDASAESFTWLPYLNPTESQYVYFAFPYFHSPDGLFMGRASANWLDLTHHNANQYIYLSFVQAGGGVTGQLSSSNVIISVTDDRRSVLVAIVGSSENQGVTSVMRIQTSPIAIPQWNVKDPDTGIVTNVIGLNSPNIPA